MAGPNDLTYSESAMREIEQFHNDVAAIPALTIVRTHKPEGVLIWPRAADPNPAHDLAVTGTDIVVDKTAWEMLAKAMPRLMARQSAALRGLERMADTKPYNKTLQPILQELHLLLHDLEQDKVRVRTLIKKLHCTELMAESSGKTCRYPICRCGDD